MRESEAKEKNEKNVTTKVEIQRTAESFLAQSAQEGVQILMIRQAAIAIAYDTSVSMSACQFFFFSNQTFHRLSE